MHESLHSLIAQYLTQIATALGQKADPARVVLYQAGLDDCSEEALRYAFGKALRGSRYFPTIAEIRIWASEYTEQKHRHQAEERSRALLDTPAKPDDWNPKMDSVWEEIERRAAEQERWDLAYVEPFTDQEILRALKAHLPYPGKDRYVDWVRRREARERRAKGIPRPRAKALYGPMFANIVGAGREPGCDDR